MLVWASPGGGVVEAFRYVSRSICDFNQEFIIDIVNITRYTLITKQQTTHPDGQSGTNI